MNGKFVQKNFGPCVICGEKNTNIQYRRISLNTLEKAIKSPLIQNMNIKIQINDQFCKRHYNELILYDRNNKSNKGKIQNTNKDRSFNDRGEKLKRICLDDDKYHELYNKAMSVDQLNQKISELEEELSKFIFKSEELERDGNTYYNILFL